ncbi:NAD(P)H dehydrogenase (quinone) [Amycolatopsis arida]|uniref:NAD(P)H dehydrogenase (Quinone) n=1 Tax=Amycolatopsis arida TaxID=587909 RepID=A0A1I5ZFI6_9PSEU|nr:NAD(P)H-dependent oxidoreductase [Amycolatopsis arida]TDX89624.1 NAD(P)H dehydrogenase (quinone) [Amycolatopsis arida]SFQ55191.1 NAD(P)H dehydrogenase (quinone) [Amycolatopsis arida]
MNVLWVFAHPDQGSLSGVLRDEGLAALASAGHRTRVSDLYAMKWKATLDRDDLGDASGDTLSAASRRAYADGTLGADIRAEHDKIDWADAVVLQFPLWWYGMPAILKGWFDRVFVKGYAYGVTDPQRPGRTLRYGQGRLAGKRALVLVTAGSREPALGPRGINGQLDLVLFPLLHGTLWYAGMSVLPPVAVYGADRVGPHEHAAAAALVRRRVAGLDRDAPLPYRTQNGGDYDDDLVLRPELAPGASGLDVHYAGGFTGADE